MAHPIRPAAAAALALALGCATRGLPRGVQALHERTPPPGEVSALFPGTPVHVTEADLDGDGRPDFVVEADGGGRVWFVDAALEQRGWRARPLPEGDRYVVELDGDRTKELVICTPGAPPPACVAYDLAPDTLTPSPLRRSAVTPHGRRLLDALEGVARR